MIHFAILTLPPSGTVYHRSHWAVKKRWRTTFALETVFEAYAAGWRSITKEKRPAYRVGITVYRRRLLDVDNLYAGCKPLLDGMRDVGILRGDTPKWCSLDVKQVQVKEKFRVEITLEKLRPLQSLKRELIADRREHISQEVLS